MKMLEEGKILYFKEVYFMDVKRLNLSAGVVTDFNFNKDCAEFLIKNFSDSDIIVCMGNFDISKSIKIISNAFEIISDVNEETGIRTKKSYNKLSIKSESGGEVEVRCL